MLLNSNSNYCY